MIVGVSKPKIFEGAKEKDRLVRDDEVTVGFVVRNELGTIMGIQDG